MGVKEGWSITRVHIRIATLEVVVEAIPILAASIGWYSLGRLLPKAAPALWTYAICTALLPCVLNTIAYLQLTQR